MPEPQRRRFFPIELGVLAAFGLAVAALGVFLVVAMFVEQGRLRSLDEAVLLALRMPGNTTDPLGPAWLESFVRDVTALGSRGILGLFVAAVMGFLALNGQGGRALAVLAFTASGSLVGEVAKLAFGRPRPDLVPHGVDVHSLSFPSAHALQASVVYLTLGALLAADQPRRRVKAYVLAMAMLIVLIVGASRIYLGVHWPSDVLAGWALGTGWAIGCWLIDRRWHSRGAPLGSRTD